MKAHTQRTDAILNSQPNDGFGLEKKQCIAQWYDHSAKIESENAELRAALESVLNHSSNDDQRDMTQRRIDARAILERTKK